MSKNSKLIIEAITKLTNKKKAINAHSIAKITDLDWRTVKSYLRDNLKIKDI